MRTPTANNAPGPAGRKWLQFSLRGLLALLVALSIPLAWLAIKRQQHLRAVREIEAAGGHVIYDHTSYGRWSQWPMLLRFLSSSALGDAILWDPYQVSFYPPNATDETLAHVSHFRHVKVLGLNETQITDAGLAHLADFPQVKLLDLSYTRITDAGLAHLTSLTSVEILNLQGTDITPAGVQRLRQSLNCEIYTGPDRTAGPTGIAPVALP